MIHSSPLTTKAPQLRARTPVSGSLLSCGLIATSSLSGALLFTVSTLGRAAPLSASKEWLLLLAGAWILLAIWALLYGSLLQRHASLTRERSLYWSALCHIPLLLGLGPMAAVYGSDLANYVYTNSAHGMVVFQPLAKGYVVLSPALAQALVLLGYRRRVLIRSLPLAGIVGFSLGLRLWSLNWGLPGLLHPDEHQYIGRGFVMFGTGDLNPHYFENPSLMIYVTYTLYRLLAQQAQPFHVVADLFQWGIQDPRGDYLIVLAARAVTAVAGTGTVIAAYLAGVEIFGRRSAMLGAATLAVSFLHVRDSHYATNDVLATAFLALSLLYSIRIYSRGQASDYLLAGLFGGLGTAAKYNVGIFAAAILVAHLARGHKYGNSRVTDRRHLLLVAGAAASLAAFAAGTPYAVLDFPSFAADFWSQFGYGASEWRGQEERAVPLLFLNTLIQGFGLVPLALSLLGIVLAARRDWRALAVLVSVPAVYLVFMSTQRLFFARFALPLLPFLAIFCGHAVRQVGGLVLRRHEAGRRILTPVILAVALLQPIALSVQHDILLGREDTRWLAARWIDTSLPPSTTLVMDSYAQLDGKFGWRGHGVNDTRVFWPQRYEKTASMGSDYDYVAVTSFGYGPWQKRGDPPSLLPAEYGVLEREGRLVVAFGPGAGNLEIPYFHEDVYTPFWNLFDRVRPGPTIRIYQRAGKEAG